MGSFREALSALAGLTIPGIAHNFDVDSAPDSLFRPQLPALIVIPGELPGQGVFGDRPDGFSAIAFAGAARTVEFRVTHLLLVRSMQDGLGVRSHLPVMVDLIDTYLDVISADLRLGDLLLEPMRVSIEPGEFERGGVRFVGAALRHRWLIELGGAA